MRSTVLLASILFLSSTALAAPARSRHQSIPQSISHQESAPSRSRGRRSRTQPPILVKGISHSGPSNNTYHDQPVYSANWAGAVQLGQNISHVIANVTFPNVSLPDGADQTTTYGGSVWVGIDGDTCQSAILQTGIDWYIQDNQTTYQAWYEWFPEASALFDITVNPGDEIHMGVTSHAPNRGTAHIRNLSTNESVHHHFHAQTSPLCNTNAEWIVEDFSVADSSGKYGLIPFSDFSTVTISEALYVYGDNATQGGVDGAMMMDIQQNGNVLTNCQTQGNTTVVCEHA